jgi:glycosyltransferase involved in cell wall biosynthesis
MKIPATSIIVPVWNGQDQLTSCLEAVLKQDYPAELIIIDDGSTDRSLEVAKNIVLGRPNVKILTHSENQGLGRTLNEGIKHARGEYLLIVHQDCEIAQPDFLEKAVKAMEERADTAAVTGRRTYTVGKLCENEKLFMVANGHIAEMNHQAPIMEDLPFVEHKCDLFRKSLLENVGGFPGNKFRSSGEDQVVSNRLRRAGYRLVRLGSVAYNLSFGKRESSMKGIFEKLWTYGKTQAGVLLSEGRSSLRGVRNSDTVYHRTLNRVTMLLSASAMIGGFVLSVFSLWFLLIPASVIVLRLLSYGRGLRRLNGRIRLALFGPLLDLLYSFGFAEGLIARTMGKEL